MFYRTTAVEYLFGGAWTSMMGNRLAMMHHIWTATRSILAVLAGIAAMTVVIVQ